MKIPVGTYVSLYTTDLNPYPHKFIFATSVEDFDDICTELAKRHNQKGQPNRWLDFRGKFRGLGICATGAGISILAARYDENKVFNPAALTSLIGTMTHEINHMLLHTCTRIGYNPMREHEPFTYLGKWVYEQFVRFMVSYHGLSIASTPVADVGKLRVLHQAGALDNALALHPNNVRDALARESRALLGNTVVVNPSGSFKSTTYFEL